jgi:two-component SAPR family response regulator
MRDFDGCDLYYEIKKIDDKVKICFLTASEMYYIIRSFRKEQYCTLDKDIFLRKLIQNEELIKQINKIVIKNPH